MRYLLTFIFSVSAFFAQAQQVNPVTDYTFANKMSAGRNTVTDTAAYFSVGPRFGAIRGMMPPIVVDTAVVVANKRNGLLIFSVQKNKMQVWDSAGSKWADLTGAAGSAITSADTAAMLLPYLRKADTTAMLSPYLKESDTVWLSNRIDLKVNIADTSTMLSPYLRGSGTANYLPKFNASRSIIDSKVYEVNTNLLFNTTTPSVTASGYGTFDLNGSTASLLAFKKGDTSRGYIGHNGATMDINNTQAGDIRFYTSSTLRGRFQTDGTFRLNSLTGTGDRIVTADANGVLSATSSATGLVDTTVLSTRDWRQKGDDSLGAIIATKGSGTVTSVATGYGLSGGTITTTGTISADTALLASRLRVGKVVDSLALVKQNVLTNPVTGTGTTNYVPKFTGTSTIGNSLVYDDGTYVGIGTTTPVALLSLLQTGNTFTDGIALQRTGLNRGTIFLESPTNTLNITRGKDAGNGILLNGQDETILGSTTDNGAYRLQIDGTNSIYTSTGGIFAASSGNISVGTTDMTTGDGRLRVLQHLRIPDATTETNALLISTTSSLSTIQTRYPTPLAFGISAVERGRFNANGEFLLNTTTDAGDYKLQVSGDILAGGRLWIRTGTEAQALSTYRGANSVGRNIFIGGGGNSSIGAVGETFKGSYNISLGGSALNANTTGYDNTAFGDASLNANTTGYLNSGFGSSSLTSNTSGYENIGIGAQSLLLNTTGYRNISIGNISMRSNSTGYNNIAIGYEAGRYTNAGGNNQTSFNSMYLGTDARSSASGNENEIVIGYQSRGNGSNTVTIGNSSTTSNYFTGSIRTTAPTDGTAAPWRLGSYVTTAPTATGYVQVEINGVKYKLLAATY